MAFENEFLKKYDVNAHWNCLETFIKVSRWCVWSFVTYEWVLRYIEPHPCRYWNGTFSTWSNFPNNGIYSGWKMTKILHIRNLYWIDCSEATIDFFATKIGRYIVLKVKTLWLKGIWTFVSDWGYYGHWYPGLVF